MSGGILSKNWKVIFQQSCMQAKKWAKLENGRHEPLGVGLPQFGFWGKPSWWPCPERSWGKIVCIGRSGITVTCRFLTRGCEEGQQLPASPEENGFSSVFQGARRETFLWKIRRVLAVTLAWRHFWDIGSTLSKSPLSLRRFKAKFLISKESFQAVSVRTRDVFLKAHTSVSWFHFLRPMGHKHEVSK